MIAARMAAFPAKPGWRALRSVGTPIWCDHGYELRQSDRSSATTPTSPGGSRGSLAPRQTVGAWSMGKDETLGKQKQSRLQKRHRSSDDVTSPWQ
jgi:hypothetical protein